MNPKLKIKPNFKKLKRKQKIKLFLVGSEENDCGKRDEEEDEREGKRNPKKKQIDRCFSFSNKSEPSYYF